MKRLLSCLLTVAMLIFSITLTAYAANGSTSYTVSNATAAPGETVELIVSLDNQIDGGFGFAAFLVEFDTEYLTLQSVVPGSAISDVSKLEDYSFFPQWDNSLQYGNGDYVSNITISGEIAILTFLVHEDAPAKTYDINLSEYEGMWFCDWEGNDLGIERTVIPGAITVSSSSGTDMLEDFTPTDSTNSTAVVTAPEGGWVTGENTFTVECANACVVAVKTENGYEALPATLVDGNTYSFTVTDLTAETELVVAIKGDANGDGAVDLNDAALINRSNLSSTHGAYKVLSELNACLLDLNGDGVVDMNDAALLNRSCLSATHGAYKALAW